MRKTVSSLELPIMFGDNSVSFCIADICLLSFEFDSFTFNPFKTDRYHIETSPLICGANHQWTGFYMITASVLKGLKLLH